MCLLYLTETKYSETVLAYVYSDHLYIKSNIAILLLHYLYVCECFHSHHALSPNVQTVHFFFYFFPLLCELNMFAYDYSIVYLHTCHDLNSVFIKTYCDTSMTVDFYPLVVSLLITTVSFRGTMNVSLWQSLSEVQLMSNFYLKIIGISFEKYWLLPLIIVLFPLIIVLWTNTYCNFDEINLVGWKIYR